MGSLLGQSLSGDFAIERVTGTGGVVTAIAARNVTFSLGVGGNGVKLTGGEGAFVLTAAGLAGRLSGQVVLTLPAGMSASGSRWRSTRRSPR